MAWNDSETPRCRQAALQHATSTNQLDTPIAGSRCHADSEQNGCRLPAVSRLPQWHGPQSTQGVLSHPPEATACRSALRATLAASFVKSKGSSEMQARQ